MISELEDVPGNALGFSFDGMITNEDYKTVLIPAAESALKSGHKLRLLAVLGPGFKGYEPSAMWDDTAFGFRHFFDFERIACVTDNATYRTMVQGVGVLMPAMVKVFAMKDLEEAKAWLAE